MDIKNLKENDDGSLTMEVTLDEEENQCLIEYAINGILKESFEEHKKQEEALKNTFAYQGQQAGEAVKEFAEAVNEEAKKSFERIKKIWKE